MVHAVRLIPLQLQQLRKELEEAKNGQANLIERLIACCKEVSVNDDAAEVLTRVIYQIASKPNAERTQHLFQSLKEEFERKVPRAKKGADDPAGG